MSPRDPEDEVIALLAARAHPRAGTLGIGDDAAIPPPPAGVPLLTVDTMVEGRHWDHRLDPADVGWKLVAVNVSDIGAMGGRPEWALLALTLPRPLDLGWVRAFAEGLGAALQRWDLPLLGGDTTGGPARVASLTVGGSALRPVLRSGARPGDRLWVTGTLGRSAEALLSPAPRAEALGWLRRPVPPVALGEALGRSGRVSAMMDLSDGLARDLPRLCAASGVAAVVDPAALPGDGPLSWRMAFGEDYELLFTAPDADADWLHSLAMGHGTRIRAVGHIVEGHGCSCADGSPWPTPLDSHFPEPG